MIWEEISIYLCSREPNILTPIIDCGSIDVLPKEIYVFSTASIRLLRMKVTASLQSSSSHAPWHDARHLVIFSTLDFTPCSGEVGEEEMHQQKVTGGKKITRGRTGGLHVAN